MQPSIADRLLSHNKTSERGSRESDTTSQDPSRRGGHRTRPVGRVRGSRIPSSRGPPPGGLAGLGPDPRPEVRPPAPQHRALPPPPRHTPQHPPSPPPNPAPDPPN